MCPHKQVDARNPSIIIEGAVCADDKPRHRQIDRLCVTPVGIVPCCVCQSIILSKPPYHSGPYTRLTNCLLSNAPVGKK